MIILVIFQG